MANELNVKFNATTEAAVREVDKLSDAVRQNVDASDAAGKSNKSLGQEVAATKALQAAAAEATRRATAATREAELAEKAHGASSKEAAAATAKRVAAEEAAKKAVIAATAALEKNAAAVTDLVKSEDKLSPATKRLVAEIAKLGTDAERTGGDLRRMELQVLAAGRSADKGKVSMAGFLGSFAGNLAANAVGAIAGHFKDAAGWVLATGASYETLRISLETVTGSSAKAAIEFERLQAFAAATPFGVAEVTDAYIKLANRGIQPTDRALTAFGNTASAMGKTLDDMVEAVADAVTGENERLKEFGIVGALAGDQVMYTFRGVTTSVKRDAASIQEYLTKIGEQNFAGGMEKQSQSLAGKWSTLVDQASALADTFMQGLAPALKEIMDSFSIGDDGAKDFAKTLGQDVGTALKGIAMILHGVVAALRGLSDAVHWVSDAVNSSQQIYALAEDNLRKLRGEVGLMEERLIDSTMALKGQRDTMTDWLAATTLSTQAQINLNEAVLAGKKIAYGKSVEDAREAAETQRRAREDMARLEDMTRKRENAARRAKEAELGALMGDSSLTPSEKKRRNALAKDLDVTVPTKGSTKKAKDQNVFARDSMDFDADVATFAAKQSKEAREANLKSQHDAFEAETALRERRMAQIDQEMALLDQRAGLESTQVDMIWWTVDVESEAEERRRQLQDERIAREEELARWQIKNAKTAADRETAQTRLLAAEDNKRALAANRAAEEERKAILKRQAVQQKFSNVVTDLSGAMVSAAWESAQGQKGAMAFALAEYLKTTAKQMAVKAAVETAYGVAALAGIYTAALAPGHFAAAGMAAAAAALAGGAGYAASKVGEARAGSAPKSAEAGSESYGDPARGNAAPRSQGIEREGKRLEHMEHPISREEARRSGTEQRGETPINITVNVGTMLGDKDKKQLGQDLAKMVDEARSYGKRY